MKSHVGKIRREEKQLNWSTFPGSPLGGGAMKKKNTGPHAFSGGRGHGEALTNTLSYWGMRTSQASWHGKCRNQGNLTGCLSQRFSEGEEEKTATPRNEGKRGQIETLGRPEKRKREGGAGLQ